MFQIKICAKQQILIDGLYKKGWRLRLQSTVTSDGGEQKLGNNLWHEAESTATIVCSQNHSKWNTMFETHVKTYIDCTSFNWRSVLISSYHISLFSGWWPAQWASSQNVQEDENLKLSEFCAHCAKAMWIENTSISNQIYVQCSIVKCLQSRVSSGVCCLTKTDINI